jgi:predicted RNA-binding Zn ribbon-like protein
MPEALGTDNKLCLDFINTVSWRSGPNLEERLLSPADLAAWGENAGLLAPGEAARWDADPERGRLSLAQAVTVRELLFRLLAAVAAGNPPAAEDLDAFNARLRLTLGRACLVREENGYTWTFCAGREPLQCILDPVLKSAADLLVSPGLKRLKICADGNCGWLFFDMSRNRSRRWCDMKDCGNRAKARSYYRRQSSPRTPRKAPNPDSGG